MIGKTISQYKIIEKIGEGGMGEVYLADDLKLDRQVAIKFLPVHLTKEKGNIERFEREAKAASALQHNNICTIHDIDMTDDGQSFIVMDFYDGETLKKKIERKPLDIDESIDIFIQVAQGLDNAHKKDIVHRDIKPANIMMTKEGTAKILDFGLAKLTNLTQLTKEGVSVGTVAYMSPEQAKSENVDHRTDIWSFGVNMYEMLTGQLPFKGEYESAVIYSIIHDTQEPVTGLRTGVPMELERIINKCLKKNPGERYQHVDELIVDLKSLQRNSEFNEILARSEKQKKRFKSLIISLTVLSILILVIAGYFFVFKTDKNEIAESSIIEWENSIAVLPFENISADEEQEYFCDGMTEQIISNLTKLQKLKVIARTSVMTYKNTDKKIPEIGKELNVTHILEGSVRKFGDRMRVTAQLIKTEDGFHLWSEDFDKKYADLFDVQDEISEKIANALLENLSANESLMLKTNKPANIAAWEYLKKGEYIHLNRFMATSSPEDFRNAEQMLKKAIELDPNYAPAYAFLTDLYNSYYYRMARTEEESTKYLKLQEAYIQKAVDINPELVEVQASKVYVHEAKYEIDEAYACTKRALKINPNHFYSNQAAAWFFARRGLYPLAIKYDSKALEFEPLHAIFYAYRANSFNMLGEHAKAETDYRKVFEIVPNHVHGLRGYGWFLIRLKRYEEAEKILNQIEKYYPNENTNLLHALIYASKGDKEKALNTFKNKLAELYSLLGMKDEAISLINKYYEQDKENERSWYLYYKNITCYDNLRSDPRFQEILAKYKKIYEENLEKYPDINK